MGDIKNEISYSNSRERLLNECERAFWYQYYLSWGGWEKNAPDKVRAAYVAKYAQSRMMWAGDVVHQVAAQALATARRRPGWFEDMGSGDIRKSLMNKAQDLIDRGLDDTRTHAYLGDPKHKTHLLDITLGFRFNEDDFRDKVADFIHALTSPDKQWANSQIQRS
jgi:hypothetical protein